MHKSNAKSASEIGRVNKPLTLNFPLSHFTNVDDSDSYKRRAAKSFIELALLD